MTAKKKRPTLASLQKQLDYLTRALGGVLQDPTTTGLGQRVDTANEALRSLNHVVGAHGEDIARLRDLYDKLTLGLGGSTWTTMNGHTRWIALLTTPHLENLLRGWAKGSTRANIEEELERRRIDRFFRQGKLLPESPQEMADRKFGRFPRGYKRAKGPGLRARLRAAWRAFRNPLAQ